MTFLEGKKQKLQFRKAKLHQDKDGNRIATIALCFEDGPKTEGLTETLGAAVLAMDKDHQLTQIKIDEAIPGQNIDFYPTPDAKPNQEFGSVTLESFVMRREDKPLRLVLDFDFTVSLDEVSPKWLFGSYGYELWAVIEQAQRELGAAPGKAASGQAAKPN